MSQSVKIGPVKGYPMLDWVDKKAPNIATAFPAQLVEASDIANPPESIAWKVLDKNWCNLILHGDNMEVLASLLVAGFRGKVDLIYIDPPFDSGADYVRKVVLRGPKNGVLKGAEGSLLEKKQYEDIWKDDTYLQYMYERLILMRELLSEQGSIYLHCDDTKSHHLRFLMDEVFGQDNFINEIIWGFRIQGVGKNTWAKKHNNIFWYSKNTGDYIFHSKKEKIKYEKLFIGVATEKPDIKNLSNAFIEKIKKKIDSREILPDACKKLLFNSYSTEVYMRDVWDNDDTKPFISGSSEYLHYPTQKPEKLLERIIKASSNEDSLVLDCFCGSGTTAAVAERLGRRWIACDMNKGAIQTTVSRLLKNNGQKETQHKSKKFAQYRVNNYDFGDQDEKKELIKQTYGVEKIPSDLYFDGTSRGALVKIAPLNRALAAKDIEDIIAKLRERPDEDRNILLVGYGSEESLYKKMEEHNRHAAINIISVQDVQKDQLYEAMPSKALVDFQQKNDKVNIKIKDFVSPAIMRQLDKDRSPFQEDIGDFRAQIDRVFIDNNYNGKIFNIVKTDIPNKKTELVGGTYEVSKPSPEAIIAVKIIDMLGEETLNLYPEQTPK